MRSAKFYDLNHKFVKQLDCVRVLDQNVLKEYTGIVVWDDNGIKRWLVNGKLHREDGPAVEWPSGMGTYWLNDEYVFNIPSSESFKLYVGLLKLKGLM